MQTNGKKKMMAKIPRSVSLMVDSGSMVNTLASHQGGSACEVVCDHHGNQILIGVFGFCSCTLVPLQECPDLCQ